MRGRGRDGKPFLILKEMQKRRHYEVRNRVKNRRKKMKKIGKRQKRL